MGIKDWARRKNRELHRQAMEDRDSRLWHSHAFHRYFEGYTEYKELGTDGKARLRRVYTAAHYVQDLSRHHAVCLRAGYLVLFALMAVCIALVTRAQGSAGQVFYVVIPEVGTLICLAWLGYTLAVSYLFAPAKMTIHDYHSSSVMLLRLSFVLIWLFLADMLGTALECLLRGTAAYASWPTALLLFVFGAACAFVMHHLETRVPYRTLENPASVPEDGVPVDGPV